MKYVEYMDKAVAARTSSQSVQIVALYRKCRHVENAPSIATTSHELPSPEFLS